MKRTMKKLVSLVLTLVISLTATVPAFATTEKSAKKQLTNQTINHLSSSGLIYGPWFGNGNEDYTTNPKYWASIAEDVATALALYVPHPVAKKIAESVAAGCNIYKDYGSNPSYVYGTIHKTYREVKYSDGSFAWFESHYVIHSYFVDTAGNTYDLGTETETYKGSSPMVAAN